MDWIGNGYRLLWETATPATREFPNAPSAFEHREFVASAFKEMVEAGAHIRLPKDQRPTMVITIGVVRKPCSHKFRLVIDMRHVNKHLAKKVSKFEGLSDLVVVAEKGDHSVSKDPKSD